MKYIFVFAALFAVALAAPVDDFINAKILRLDSDVTAEGYTFGLETSDGISRQEEGHLTNVGTEQGAVVVKGTYSYTAPNGQHITVNFVADENGYHPHLVL